MSLSLTAPLTAPEMDALVAQAETLLCYAHPEVEIMAFRLARAVRQLRTENAEMLNDIHELIALMPELEEDDSPLSSSLLH